LLFQVLSSLTESLPSQARSWKVLVGAECS
jgi:hypothetical protein